MTPDGQFRDGSAFDGGASAGPVPGVSAIPARVMGVAVLVALVAGVIGIAFLALWLALQLIPIAIGAALIAYGVFRFQMWRARHALARRGVQVRR